MAKRPVPKYDFKAFGAAIKAAREGRKESRKKVGDEMFISPRYLANIENKGQHPSLQIFFELIQRYHISVDQFLLDTPAVKDTKRRQLDALLEAWVYWDNLLHRSLWRKGFQTHLGRKRTRTGKDGRQVPAMGRKSSRF